MSILPKLCSALGADGSLRYKGYILVENENPNRTGEDQVQILGENGSAISSAKTMDEAKKKVDSLVAYYKRSGM